MGAVRRHRAPVVPATPAYEHELGRLLRIAEEGFYWQGEVEDLLIATRDGGDLAQLARAGGPIISRFEAMRIELGAFGAPALRADLQALDEIFANHAMVLGGVGSQGERLAELTARLKRLAGGA